LAAVPLCCPGPPRLPVLFLFFHGPPSAEIYTLSLHDALPISHALAVVALQRKEIQTRPGIGSDHGGQHRRLAIGGDHRAGGQPRSEEHTSELQSRENLVCRLLLEKKKEKGCTAPTHG